MRWALLLVSLVACSFDRSGGGAGGGSSDGGSGPDGRGGRGDGGAGTGFRKRITVDAPGGGDLVDFPLYIQLDDASLFLVAVDEVRIATRVRSPGWIATEFANQSAPATFYTVGGEEPL